MVWIDRGSNSFNSRILEGMRYQSRRQQSPQPAPDQRAREHDRQFAAVREFIQSHHSHPSHKPIIDPHPDGQKTVSIQLVRVEPLDPNLPVLLWWPIQEMLNELVKLQLGSRDCIPRTIRSNPNVAAGMLDEYPTHYKGFQSICRDQVFSEA